MFLDYVRSNAQEHNNEPDKKMSPITTDERFERVILLINQHFYNVNLDLNQAAQEAALSRYYFSRYFKQKTGQCFYDYLSFVRLSHAQEMLLKTDLPVMDIAIHCGFSSLSTFFRVFKTETGYTPSQYRERKKQ
jgi:AraC-like DNA-binding protein